MRTKGEPQKDERQKKIAATIRATWPTTPESTAWLWAGELVSSSFTEKQIYDGIRKASRVHDYPSAKRLLEQIRLVRDDFDRSRALPAPKPVVPEGERLRRVFLASKVLNAAVVLDEFKGAHQERKCDVAWDRLMRKPIPELEDLVQKYVGKLKAANKSTALFDEAVRSIVRKRKEAGDA